MQVKTSALIDLPLDYAVSKALKRNPRNDVDPHPCSSPLWYEHTNLGWRLIQSYSTNWSHAGLIIDSEDIDIIGAWDNVETWPSVYTLQRTTFSAGISYSVELGHKYTFQQDGPTKLIAAMRCFVLSQLGEYVDIPEEIIKIGNLKNYTAHFYQPGNDRMKGFDCKADDIWHAEKQCRNAYPWATNIWVSLRPK